MSEKQNQNQIDKRAKALRDNLRKRKSVKKTDSTEKNKDDEKKD